MKHLYSLLTVFAFALLFYASATVNKTSFTTNTYPKWEERESRPYTAAYEEPIILPAPETEQLQKKGDVTISCEIRPYRIDSIINQKKDYITANPNRPGYDVLEIENTPAYVPHPDNVEFVVKIRNGQDRVLRLHELAVVLLIDGVQYSFPEGSIKEWDGGILVKGFEKSYPFAGPKLSALRNAKVLYFSINDVPVEYDQAGNVTKRENYEWYFTCELRQVQKPTRITYAYNYEAIDVRKCAPCDGRGYFSRTETCKTCGGYGKLKNQYNGEVYTCNRCKGEGKITLQDKCGGCDGQGKNEFPMSEMPRAVSSTTWTGWNVQVKTIPAGATIKVVDVNTGQYKNAGTSNTTVTWYSSDSESYPIIVEYHGREIKVLKTLFALVIFSGIQTMVFAQVDPNDRLSISLSYGNEGTAFRGDLQLKELNIIDPFTSGKIKFYLELAFKRITFDEPNISYNSINYPSNARVTGLGAGLCLDLKYNQWNVNPYVGVRSYYVRFTDQTLIDAIGESGLQRYWTDEWGNKYPVGPEVPNGYGDAFSFDIGGSVGYHITPVLEIGALLGLSPVAFDTGSTLFGPYFGEAPYPNSFYVKISSIRIEGRIRFNF